MPSWCCNLAKCLWKIQGIQPGTLIPLFPIPKCIRICHQRFIKCKSITGNIRCQRLTLPTLCFWMIGDAKKTVRLHRVSLPAPVVRVKALPRSTAREKLRCEEHGSKLCCGGLNCFGICAAAPCCAMVRLHGDGIHHTSSP